MGFGARSFILASLGGLLMPIAAPARAEHGSDRVWLRAGAYRPSFDSKARIDIPNTPVDGTVITFEGDLGLDDRKTVADVEAGARILGGLRVEAGYFSLRRTGERSLGRDIRWEETVYSARARVESGFRSDIYRLALGYSFIRSEPLELGVRAGLHVTTFKLFIEGEASVSDRPVGVKREEKQKTLPLPHLGLFANYRLSRTFTLHGDANHFELEVGRYKGRLTDLSAGITARVTPHVGIGAGYRRVDYGLRARSDRWEGRVDYSFNGPEIYLEAAF